MAAPVVDTASKVSSNGVAGSVFVMSGMTTLVPDEVILFLVSNTTQSSGAIDVTSITGGGLTFQRYAARAVEGMSYFQRAVSYSGEIGLELWWAHAPDILTGAVFTVTFDASVGFAGLTAFGVYGCLTPAAPWDNNGSLPAIASAVSGGTTLAISTSHTFDLLLSCSIGALAPVTGAGADLDISDPLDWTENSVVTNTGPPLGLAVTPWFQTTACSLASLVTVSGLDVSYGLDQPPLINAVIFLSAALVGVDPTPPPTPAVLNMDNVRVTSLATESPCTVAQFTTPPGVSPAVGLRWSDTRGKTYGNPVPQELSNDPISQLQWNRTGYARDRVFELFWSAASKTALNGAFVIVEPWKS